MAIAVVLGAGACGDSGTTGTGPGSGGGLDLPTASTVAIPAGAQRDVTPGAFCSPQGAQGVTTRGVVMTCKPAPDDTRNRWRSG